MKIYFVIVDGDNGIRLRGAASAMAELSGAEVRAVSFGRGEAARYHAAGAAHVYEISGAEDEAGKALALRRLAEREAPEMMLFPSTPEYRTVAPMAAAMLETGLTADCTGIALTEEGLLRQTRPALGGSVTVDILCEKARPQMATVQENALPEPVYRPRAEGTVSCEELYSRPLLRVLSENTAESAGPGLRGARVIISGGKGVGGREGFRTLRELASRIPGAAVGASRGAVSANYAPYECQVGLTGEFVRPQIYVAFGISGAVQHLVGMRSSGRIIAVNTDPDAPIFDYSDVAVTAPWAEVAEELLSALPASRSAGRGKETP